jgi:PKD repeat protein
MSVSFTNTSQYATSYSWSFGDGTTSTVASPTKSYNNTSTTNTTQNYTINLTCTGPGGTTSAPSRTVTVYNQPVASFTRAPRYSIANLATQQMNEVLFNRSTSQFATSYAWNFGDCPRAGCTSTAADPSRTYDNSSSQNADTYTVSLQVSNAGGVGCSNTTTRTVCAPAKPVINIPAGGFVEEGYSPSVTVNMNHNCGGDSSFSYSNRVLLFYKKSTEGSYQNVICTFIAGDAAGTGDYLCDLSSLIFEPNVVYDVRARASNGLISKDSVGTDQFTFESLPWYQVQGGGIHSDDGDIFSELPKTSDNLFTGPGFITRSDNLDTGNGGIGSSVVVTRSGNFNAKNLDYRYWRQKLDGNLNLWNGGAIPSTPANTIYATNAALNDAESILQINGGNVSGVFVLIHKGDINIISNVTVGSNGAVVIIASGDITINNSVTNVQGFYIADGKISTAENSNPASQLRIEGGLISWNDVELLRTLGPSANYNTPAELFVYRGNMVNILRSIPELKVFNYSWNEVNP